MCKHHWHDSGADFYWVSVASVCASLNNARFLQQLTAAFTLTLKTQPGLVHGGFDLSVNGFDGTWILCTIK